MDVKFFFHMLYEFRSVVWTLIAVIAVSKILKRFFTTLRRSK